MAILKQNLRLEQARFEFADEPGKSSNLTSTFADNLSLPIHRWFRYSAGFSAAWVRALVEQERANGRRNLFDPFAGSGTVLLEGELCHSPSMGLEAHPFVARVAKAKLQWHTKPKDLRDYGMSMLIAAKSQEASTDGYPPLIQRCYPPDTLLRLDSLRRAWEAMSDHSPLSELTWLALAAILRECSPVGTAQWQYILPNRAKAKTVDPYKAFEAKIYLMSGDMATVQALGPEQPRSETPSAILHQEDARECRSVPDSWAHLVITSPPYANNYDYADATRLEMSFFGEVRGWGDLQESVRRYLVRSCTQHVSTLSITTLLRDDALDPIRTELEQVCSLLQVEREQHGGKKAYHTMIAAYFHDMAKVMQTMRRIATPGALMCFVVGDSAPYGIHVPVDRWLGELAMAVGFRAYRFEKTRDRNVKWENRKHRVPLHEGRLWIEG